MMCGNVVLLSSSSQAACVLHPEHHCSSTPQASAPQTSPFLPPHLTPAWARGAAPPTAPRNTCMCMLKLEGEVAVRRKRPQCPKCPPASPPADQLHPAGAPLALHRPHTEHVGQHQRVLPQQRVGHCALGTVDHELQPGRAATGAADVAAVSTHGQWQGGSRGQVGRPRQEAAYSEGSAHGGGARRRRAAAAHLRSLGAQVLALLPF